ncbi:hypothetical protein [Leptolyngbya sp. FACHB-17]|uniref:hypothetical protein n=1 Tax=unclassified Leptolyngbya TaxID=2650499 RepID=UPI0016809170|nr:hypothetical protein [Leptolyngbya sp. FACHB-17]MBD2081394.1 hypothetical protein [Leptolyngbya sp. FACHB-17]
MKSSSSWEGFNRPSRAESKLETISLLYSYDLLDPDFPDEVKHFLLSLEEKLGGTRCPIVRGSGSNFLSPVTPAIGLVVSFVIAPFIRKYLDGLLNGDALKEIGESHREEIASWFFKLEKELTTIVAVTNGLLKDYPHAVVCRHQKTDLILKVDLGNNQLSIALNKYHSDEARAMIPSSIVKAVKYIVENQLKGSLGDFSLQYNFQSKEWCMHVTTLIKLSEKS